MEWTSCKKFHDYWWNSVFNILDKNKEQTIKILSFSLQIRCLFCCKLISFPQNTQRRRRKTKNLMACPLFVISPQASASAAAALWLRNVCQNNWKINKLFTKKRYFRSSISSQMPSIFMFVGATIVKEWKVEKWVNNLGLKSGEGERK